MIQVCQWCGKRIDTENPDNKDSIEVSYVWDKRVTLCSRCSKYKKEHRCISCSSIVRDRPFINGLCTRCFEARVTNGGDAFQNKTVTKSMLQSLASSIWSRPANQDSIDQFDIVDKIRYKDKEEKAEVLKSQSKLPKNYKTDLLSYGFGTPEGQEWNNKLKQYSGEVQKIIDRYSGNLNLEDKSKNRYTLVFVDYIISNKLTYKLNMKAGAILGDGPHIVLMRVDNKQMETK